ncbi:hypothetical protein QBC34DRAFT_485423 [Podospora aff. communis PSN243]|uniref:Uncharacterized protein n=1 Tax=Podospora aff. communis PSN243 TaxID=3040156 RepID=A0AAV9GJU9_9PEZI|nr:hypothetical protein QBC34DRAFT_485423 [Podospora aff. communis PSN243]
MDWSSPPFYPLTPQSSQIPFSEWITLLTLCLAPIIAHIAAGVPQPTYLNPRSDHHQHKPAWHNHLPHYNPISILHRYAAITDRRIRCLPGSWSPALMAASNALFWTESHGWDGSEAVASSCVAHLMHAPKRAHASLLSWESVKTAVVTLQGVQVVWLFAAGFAGRERLPSFAVDMIAFPVAVLGILRVWPACWLTDDYAFGGGVHGGARACVDAATVSAAEGGLDDWFRAGQDERGKLLKGVDGPFRGSGYWPSRVFRVVFILPLVGLLPVGVLTALPGPWHRTGRMSMTAYLGALLSTVNLLVAVGIYAYYAARGGCRSTVIPCISKAWYKVLTALFWIAWFGLAVVSAIETRRTPCGKYSTAREHMDAYHCPGTEFEVLSFVGTCQGVLGKSIGLYNVST